MSIAPLTPSPGFGVTPGFGINPSYGVSADPPRTAVDLTSPRQGTATFGQILAERIAALGPAAGAAATTQTPAAFGISPMTGTNTAGMNAVQGTTAVSGSSGARAGAGAGMGDFVTDRLGQLQNLHSRSDRLAVAAVTGDLQDIHEYTIAANEAGVATQLAVSVRDRAVQAFNEIIRMQL